MKALRVLVGLITLLIQLPMGLYLGYLLYSHVQATPLMWFLWWFNLPLTIIAQVINTIVEKVMKKD